MQVTEEKVAGDPLTSGGAYKPDYSGRKANTAKGGSADPFTGSSGYRPESPKLDTRGGTGANQARYIPGEAPIQSKPAKLADDFGTNPDRYIPDEKPKVEFVDKKFFPETKYQLFEEVKPSLEKILLTLKEKCDGVNVHIDDSDLSTLGMMTGKG